MHLPINIFQHRVHFSPVAFLTKIWISLFSLLFFIFFTFDVIKYSASSDHEFAWKFPREDLKLGTQLIVNEGQQAIFVKGGQALDVAR